jgi:hypothetical protein
MSVRHWAGLFLTGAGVLLGQTPEPGKLHRHESGLGIRVPAGWTTQDNVQGTVLLPPGVKFDPNRQDNPELYAALMHEGFDAAGEQEFVQELSSAFLQSGLTLTRSGEREPFSARGRTGAVYAWEFRHPATGAAYGLKFYLWAQDGRAYVVMATGEAQRINGRDAQLREVAVTLDFQAPKMPQGGPLADATPLAQQWLQKLRGKVIRQFISGGGAVGEKRRYLAPDGAYSMQGGSALAIDVGPYAEAPTASASAISRQSMTGRWKIRDINGEVFLQVWTSDGRSLMLPITTDNRNWYLDGEKAFAVDPSPGVVGVGSPPVG